MKNHRYLVVSVVFVVIFAFVFQAEARRKKAKEPEGPVVVRTVAIGDVDVGYTMGGSKPADVKETVQISLKKELDKIGKGRFNVVITSPAVEVEGADPGSYDFPALPTNRAPTSKEMGNYMAAMQKMQRQMSGQVKVHKPVTADAYFDFKLQAGKTGMDTGGLASTIGSMTGIDTSIGDISTNSAQVQLVCNMRDPASGTLQDRYTAKASSVKFRNLGGYTSYDYGSDELGRERLFKSAVNKCAKWIAGQVK